MLYAYEDTEPAIYLFIFIFYFYNIFTICNRLKEQHRNMRKFKSKFDKTLIKIG